MAVTVHSSRYVSGTQERLIYQYADADEVRLQKNQPGYLEVLSKGKVVGAHSVSNWGSAYCSDGCTTERMEEGNKK
ncbi:MAG: hypothetical protein DHS20C21_03070 [Gemmatimonadota bacterium]|nr:MAG: hypothetical protein DHS20C21_03070 [Gemmatimonadota bacterium]